MKSLKENIGVIVSFFIVIFVIILTVYLLINQKDKVDPLEGINKNMNVEKINQDVNTNEEPTNPEQKTMEQNKRTLNNFTPVSKVDNLEKIDVLVGTGEEVKEGATVSVHYTGAVASTGAIFQSSKDFGVEPVTFPLSGVIKGWTDGIPGMKVGGTRRLVIPSSMAYGANPPAGSGIPANADLVFDVELVAISK